MDLPELLAAIDSTVKVIYICSPNNPTGDSLKRDDIFKVLDSFAGIVVVDEAYIDFSSFSFAISKKNTNFVFVNKKQNLNLYPRNLMDLSFLNLDS